MHYCNEYEEWKLHERLIMFKYHIYVMVIMCCMYDM